MLLSIDSYELYKLFKRFWKKYVHDDIWFHYLLYFPIEIFYNGIYNRCFLFNKLLVLLEDYALALILINKEVSYNYYPQTASTAKLFFTPLHGSPNVSIDTPILQLRAPTHSCTKFRCSINQPNSKKTK